MKKAVVYLLTGLGVTAGCAGVATGIYFGVQNLTQSLNPTITPPGSTQPNPKPNPLPQPDPEPVPIPTPTPESPGPSLPSPGTPTPEKVNPVEINAAFAKTNFAPVNNRQAIKIDRDYSQNHNFNLIEYQYNGQYFLGQDGLNLLNQALNERLPFGPEVDQLKYISINHPFSLPGIGRVNGQYNPLTMELDLDVRSFFDTNSGNYINGTLEQKVEFVYTIILHEYGHHLANSYITAVDPDDPLSYNNLNSTQHKIFSPIGQQRFVQKSLAGDFFNQWLEALNYTNANLEQLETNQAGKTTNVYKTYSSKRIFEAANYGPSNDSRAFAASTQRFEGAFGINQTAFFNASLSNMAAYSYGVDELFTRHLVSFNYLPKVFPFWSGHIDTYSPDVALINQIILKNNNTEYDWNERAYAVDNIFGGFIKQANQTETRFDPKFNQLLNAYKAVVGEGKLVSQIFFDNTENFSRLSNNNWTSQRLTSAGFNRIKIGGYIPVNSKIKGLIIQFDDDTKALITFDKVFESKNLHTKNSPAQTNYTENNDLFKTYISKAIDLNDPLFENRTIVNIGAWEDKSDDNEVTTDELKTIENNQIVSTRPITTFRESLKQKNAEFDNRDQLIQNARPRYFVAPGLPNNFQNQQLIIRLEKDGQNLILKKNKLI